MKTKLSKEQIAIEYGMNLNPSRGNGVPVKGFYAITEIVDIKMNAHPRYLKVKAYYHPSEPDFKEQFLVHGQFSSIFNGGSKGPKDITIGELKNAVLKIESINLVPGEFEGKATEGYVVIWNIIDYIDFDSEIQTPQLGTSNIEEDHSTEVNEDVEPEYSEDEEWAFYVANEVENILSYDENEFLMDMWEDQNRPSNDLA